MSYLYASQNGIRFRKIEEEDLQFLLEIKNESWFGTHRTTIVNLTNQKKWFKSLCQEDVNCPKNLVLIAEGVADPTYEGFYPIGTFKIINIDWQNRRGEAGWDVHCTWRQKGWGKKIVKAGVDFCFELLNLRILDAQILITNKASQKCAAAAGFEQEGKQKRAIFKNKEYVDNLLYGILRD